MHNVTIYTDGGCEPNPGKGGYAAILIYGNHSPKEIFGGFEETTNNRMELFAAIVGLEALTKVCNVELHSDSKYLVDAVMNGWIYKWEKKDWRKSPKSIIPNADLWQRLLVQLKKHQIEFKWVKGHAGYLFNERCDKLASDGIKISDKQIDQGYIEQCSNNRIQNDLLYCMRCNSVLEKRTSEKKKIKEGQVYYFEYYYKCTLCSFMYMPPEAKKNVSEFNKSNSESALQLFNNV